MSEYLALPADLSAYIVPWFQKNKRQLPFRKGKDPYRILVSEIMLQQTRVQAMLTRYIAFVEALPTVEALAEVDDEQLHKLFEGLGYYRRAKNLKRAAIEIVERYGGRFPDRWDELLTLPGIGPYTAGAILSICFDQPIPAVDGNVLRVIARIAGYQGNVDLTPTKRLFFEALQSIYPTEHPGAFTEGLMELGAMVCLPNAVPLCDACPAISVCIAHQRGIQLSIPVKQKKKPRKREEKTVFLFRCGDQTALLKRPDDVLLAGLFELPNADCALSKKEAARYLAAQNLPLFSDPVLHKRHTHVFTHIEWKMVAYFVHLEERDARFLWANEDELRDRFCLPSAFRVFLDAPTAKPGQD